MKGLSGSVEDGRFVIAATARKMSPSLISYEGGDFCPMAARSQSKVAAACILSSVPYTFCSILRCETIGQAVGEEALQEGTLRGELEKFKLKLPHKI